MPSSVSDVDNSPMLPEEVGVKVLYTNDNGCCSIKCKFCTIRDATPPLTESIIGTTTLLIESQEFIPTGSAVAVRVAIEVDRDDKNNEAVNKAIDLAFKKLGHEKPKIGIDNGNKPDSPRLYLVPFRNKYAFAVYFCRYFLDLVAAHTDAAELQAEFPMLTFEVK